MGKVLKSVSKALGPLALWAGILGLAFWLIGGDTGHLLVFGLIEAVTLPVVAVTLLLAVLWTALPRWRRLDNTDRILWRPNLPSRIGSFVGAVLSPALILPSLSLVGDWIRTYDYLRLAGLAVIVIFTLHSIWLGLRMAIDEGVSVKVSAQGIQMGRRLILWSDIEAIESGFANLEGGSTIVLAGERITLSPHDHGPTGRAMIAAVQRFSPRTTIREPQFQAQFGEATA